MTERFLSLKEFAELIDVKPATLAHYKLPEPDALTGKTRGWKQETIEEWNAARPGIGWRKGASKQEQKP